MRLVVDASVVIKWAIPEEHSEAAVRLLDHQLLAPDLWRAECANVLWKKVRAGEVPAEKLPDVLEVLRFAGVETRPMDELFESAINLAVEVGHPAYDCFYLALAVAEDCPLITADRRLISKLVASSSRWRNQVISVGDLSGRFML